MTIVQNIILVDIAIYKEVDIQRLGLQCHLCIGKHVVPLCRKLFVIR